MSWAAPVSPMNSSDSPLKSSTAGCNIPATLSTPNTSVLSTIDETSDARMGTLTFKNTCNAGNAFLANSQKPRHTLMSSSACTSVMVTVDAAAAAAAAFGTLGDVPSFPFLSLPLPSLSLPLPLSPLESLPFFPLPLSPLPLPSLPLSLPLPDLPPLGSRSPALSSARPDGHAKFLGLGTSLRPLLMLS